jgi:disulfide bond formation protein DsbB
MRYLDEDDGREAPPRRAAAGEGMDLALLASRLTNGVVRVAGLVLVVVGLWAGVKVVVEAWGLYQDPSAVERLARVIDRASHIDSLVGPRAAEAAPPQTGARPLAGTASPEETFRPSYFLAWALAILLLLLVGKLASWTVRAGGALALSPGPVRLMG